MTDYSDDDLVAALGEAAAHELAAGEFGTYLKTDHLNTHDGEDIAQDLPDYNEVMPHFEAYTGMIRELGYRANEQVPAKSHRDRLPDSPIDEESALLAGYVLERQAREYAQDAIEVAGNTPYQFLVNGRGETIQFSLSDIQREEHDEVREIEDLLVEDDTYSITDREEMHENFETLDDVDALAG